MKKIIFFICLLLGISNMVSATVVCGSYVTPNPINQGLVILDVDPPTTPSCTNPTFVVEQRISGSGDNYEASSGNFSSSPFRIFYLEPCTEYDVRIIVYCGTQNEGACVVQNISTPCSECCLAPLVNNISITPITNSTPPLYDICLEQEPECEGANHVCYGFRFREVGGSWSGPLNPDVGVNCLYYTTFENCIEYEIQTRYYGICGESEWSESVFFMNCPCTGCNCNKLAPTDRMVLSSLSTLINEKLNNNFIKGQKAFITHHKEIIDLLESDRKVNRLFKDIKSAGYELLINSLVYNKEVVVDEKYYYLINEFLSSLKNATKSNDLKKSIEQAQIYLPVIQDKEVKEAIIAFDKATIARKTSDNADMISGVKLLNNLSSNTTLLFQSESKEGDLSIGLYDVNGRQILQIVDCETVSGGYYQYEIDKTNLSNGIYIIKVNYDTGNGIYQETLKLPVSR